MGLQNFIDKVGPAVSAAWLNTVDTLKYTIFGDSTTKAQARTAIELDTGIVYSGTDSGAGGAAVVTLTGVTNYVRTVGSKVSFTAVASNNTTATLNVNGTGVAAIQNTLLQALTGGELSVPVIVQWTGSVWQIIKGDITPDKARTPIEIANSIIPVDYFKSFGAPNRYQVNTTPGTTDMTVGINTALSLGLCLLQDETYFVNTKNGSNLSLIIPSTGTVIKGISKTGSKIVFGSNVQNGLTTPYINRANGASVTFVTDLTLSNFTVDITAMSNVSTSIGIWIEDSFANLIEHVVVIDPLNETSNREGLRIGRSTFTTSVRDCTIGIRHIKAAISPDTSTTIWFYNNDSWQHRMEFASDILFDGDTIQKDVDKYVCTSCNNVTIIGGDYENSGFWINNVGGTCNLFQSMGNSFAGFTGTLFNTRPGASFFLDEYSTQTSRALSSLVRAGSTVTAQVVTTTVNGIYKFQAPPVGTYITISGATNGVLNGNFVVASVNTGANSFTYTTTTSGAITENPTSAIVLPDDSVGGRYIRWFKRMINIDPVASRLIMGNRIVMSNGSGNGISGFQADGVTETQLLYVDSSGRLRMGDGSTADFLNDSGNFRNVIAGKGFTVTSPDGLTTKTITINNAGAITLI